MKYVVTANDYFNQGSNPDKVTERIASIFNGIPDSFFESLKSIDLASTIILKPIQSRYSDDRLLEHQISLIEEFDDIHLVVRNENLLQFSGYDSIELVESGKYLETISLINEGVADTVINFLKSTYEDPNPTTQTLNILQLILGIIGIVPFTWGGFPIDIVANVLNGVISIFRENYFEAVLSILSAIDVSHATATTNVILKPVAKLLNPIFKIIFRSGKEAAALEKGVVALSDSVKKLGNKTLTETLTWLFKSCAKFFTNTFIQIIRTATKFIDFVIGKFVPFSKSLGYDKFLTKAFDNLVMTSSTWGKSFDTVSSIFAKNTGEVAAAGSDIAKAATSKATTAAIKTDAELAAMAAGKVGKEVDAAVAKALSDHAAKFKGLVPEKYIDDLTKLVNSDPVFKKELARVPEALKPKAISAKVENEYLSSIVKSYDDVLKKNPELATYLARTYGVVPKGNVLVKMAKSGDVAGLKQAFELIKDPAVSKHLSKAQVRSIAPFLGKNGAEAFVSGIKKFDGSVSVLNNLTKAGGFFGQRAAQFRAFLSFMTRLIWQKYGSLDCMLLAAKEGTNDLILGTSKAPESDVQPTKSTNEADEAQPVEASQEPNSTPSIDATIKKNDEYKKKFSSENKKDCSITSAAVKAVVGSHIVDFPGSTANLGGTPNMADDPKQAEEFQKKSTEYTKSVLKSLGLDANIDAQHALDISEPINRLYYSDVWDESNGIVSPNLSTTSRMPEVAKKMVEDGVVTQEEVEALQKKALEDQQNNRPPAELKVSSGETNESFLQVTSLFTNK